MLAICSSEAASSSKYSILHDTLDAGGRRLQSSRYSIDTSVNWVGGISQSSSFNKMIRSGYAGQLSEEDAQTQNAPPSISPLANQSISEDSAAIQLDFVIGDAETAAESLIVSGSSSNPLIVPNGNLLFGGTASSRTLQLTPAANQFGTTTITISVVDGDGTQTSRGFELVVNSVNDVPVANNQTVVTDQNVPVDITLTGSDVESASLSFAIATQPAKGSLSGTAPNLTYTPAANQTGADSFTFQVNDGAVDSAAATVSISINSVSELLSINSIPPQSMQEDSVKQVAFTIVANVNLTGALDVTASASDPVLLPEGSLVSSGTGTDRSLTISPAANQSGDAVVSLSVSDALGNVASRSFVLTVLPVNDPPVAAPQTVTVVEDQASAIRLQGTDVENPSLTFAIVSSPTLGTLSGAAPNLVFTPTANANGTDSFTFKVNDGALDSAPATVQITITAVNDSPVATSQSVVTDEDTPKSITLAGTDIENNTLAFVVVSQPSKGTLTGAAPNLTYTPHANVSGTDSFSFKVNDGALDSAPAAVQITINAVNDPPVANSLAISTSEETAKSIILTGSDVENNPLTFVVVSQPAKGTLSGTAPNLNYTPDLNATGSDSFTFKANDGVADSPAATVQIWIDPVNDLPAIGAVPDQTADEDTVKVVNVTVADIETAAGNLIVSGASSNQELVPNANLVFGGSGADRTLAIAPSADRSGTTTITVTVLDTDGGEANASFLFTIQPVNDAPIAEAQNFVTDQDVPHQILLSGSDVEDDPLTFAIVTQPANGALSGTAPALTYTPTAGFSGVDSFTFKASDGANESTPATVQITVNAVSEFLSISTIASQTTDEDVPKTMDFTIDPGALPIEGLTLSASSSAADLVESFEFAGSGANRSLTIRPAANRSGTTTITVRVSDGSGVEASRSFVLAIAAVNDVPVASSLELSGFEDKALAVTLTGTDVENSALNFTVLTQPAHGTLAGAAPNLIYTPGANYFGNDSFTFRVNDGLLNSAEATVSITLQSVNDAPTLDAIADVLLQEDAGEQAIVLTGVSAGSGEAGQGLAFSLDSTDLNLTGTPAISYTPGESTATLRFTPGQNAFGVATITVKAVDDAGVANGGADSISRQFNVTITAVNDSPTISAISDTATVDGVTPVLEFAIDDVESTELQLRVVSSDPVLVPTEGIVFGGSATARTVQVTSAPGRTGSVTVTVTVADSENAEASTQFKVNVSSPAPKLDPVLTWSAPAAITYGVALGTQQLNATATVPGTFQYTPGVATVLPAGEHLLTVNFTPADSTAYNSAQKTATITVEKAPLTVQADDKLKREGGPFPELTASFIGLVNGETAESLDAPVTLTTTATDASPNGTYPIVASGASDSNYVITFVGGTLTITAKIIPTLTWEPPAAITYGTLLGASQLRAESDVRGIFSYDPAGGAVLPVGVARRLSAVFTPEDSINFETVTVAVTIDVLKAPLKARANNQSKIYGAVMPELTASYDGFVNGDSASVLDTPVVLATVATAGSSVGEYPIVAAGASDASYTVTFEPGVLTVTPAPLTIAVDNKAMTYGGTPPSFTYTISGFVNGDEELGLDTAVSVAAAFTSATPVGTHSIHVEGGADSNYTVTRVPGTLTVSPRTLTVMPRNVSRKFGEPNPTLSGTIRGLRNDDPITATYTTTATVDSPEGSYPITATLADPQGKLGNYSVVLQEGTLSIRREKSFAGVAHDGYVAGATVFFDANKDGVRQSDEPATQTDGSGLFDLPVLVEDFDSNNNGELDPSEGTIVLTGGIDITTGVALQTTLTAPPGATVISPITTLLTATIENNPHLTVAESKARLNQSLGIPASIEVTSYDPIAAASANDAQSAQVITVGAKIQDTLVQISSVLSAGDSGTKAETARAVVATLATTTMAGTPLNLDEAASIQNMIQQSAVRLGKSVSGPVTSAAASIISDANQVKTQVAAAAENPVAAALEISRSQVAGQTVVANVLEQVSTGALTTSEAATQASKTAIAQAVQSAPVGDLLGEEERPGTFDFSADQYATSAGGTQANITVHRTEGNAGVVKLRVLLSAAGSGDSVPFDFEVDNRKLVQTFDLLPFISSSSQLNGREQINLSLTLGAGQSIEARLGARTAAGLAVRIPPRISRHPVSQLVPGGRTVTFSIAATGTPAPAYQWRRNGVNIPGRTQSSLVLASVGEADAGSYDVLISNAAGTLVSSPATLSIARPPEILRSPASKTVVAGSVLALDVLVSGTPPFIYAWEKDGQTIPGAVQPFLNVSNAGEGDSGEYRVRISNVGGIVTAATIVRVYRPINVALNPGDQRVLIGTPVQFRGSVSGTGPLTLQWFKDEFPIAGATGEELQISQTRVSDAGSYFLEVTSPFAKVRSAPVQLRVSAPPFIRTHPVGRTVSAGQEVRLSVEASGEAPLSYQWYRDGVPLTHGTGAILLIASAREADAGMYQVRVSNPIGSATSTSARLSVSSLQPPAIVLQPVSQTVSAGTNVVLQVVASGGAPLSYQWFKGSQPIANATSERLELTAIQPSDSGEYTVSVSNPAGGVFSAIALVTVRSVTASEGDFDNDGRPEIVLQDGSGSLGVWFLRGAEVAARSFEPKRVDDPNWRIAGSGDWNSDGKEDLFFQHADGTLGVWFLNGLTLLEPSLTEPAHPGNRNWRVTGVGDMNRDGRPDLVYQHTDGTLGVWFMNGTSLGEAKLIEPAQAAEPRWKVAAVADFDGSGSDDLLFQHNDGTLAVWFMDGIRLERGALLDPSHPGSLYWRVAGAADWNQDGRADVLLENWIDSSLGVWFMNGSTLLEAQLLSSPGGTWKPVAPK